MAVDRRLTIPGILAKVPEACDFVVQAAEATGLDERSVYYCQMAVDEWCTNIIEHGYGEQISGLSSQQAAEQAEYRRIEISCEGTPNTLTITIGDDSSRFDPTQLSDEEPSQLLDEREPGGLGWFFIRRIMDGVRYEFRDGKNFLTMVKHASQAQVETARPGVPGITTQIMPHDIWLIKPTGRLDASSGPALEVALNAQLGAAHNRIVVDMADVTYISSGGLKVLVATWRKAQKSAGTVVLSSLLPRVRKVFEISGFDMLFTITASVDDAIASINSLSGHS
jgi:anti-anti-sigma factor